MKKLIHTPEGVRDLYNIECARKEAVRVKICEQLREYGFRDIETPTFEFFDIFSKEKGSVPSNEMFKFFDRDGNTLVLRPDITPSIARAVAKYFIEEEIPVRLSYCGSTFQNNLHYQGRLAEQTQIGGELVGDSSEDADAEIIALVVNALTAAGLTDFQVEIGNVEFFYGLMEEGHFDEEQIDRLRELIENKNYFGVEDLLAETNVSEGLRKTILKLPGFFGGAEVLTAAEVMAKNTRSYEALERLKRVYEILKMYGVENRVSFDLGMLGKYRYYTGIIFRGLTYGTGESIVTGGRYDRLLSQYGKDTPSIGFGIVLDVLMNAMSRQKITVDTDMARSILLYDEECLESAVRRAENLRREGARLMLMKKAEDKPIEDYIAYADRYEFTQIMYLTDGDEIRMIPTGGAER